MAASLWVNVRFFRFEKRPKSGKSFLAMPIQATPHLEHESQSVASRNGVARNQFLRNKDGNDPGNRCHGKAVLFDIFYIIIGLSSTFFISYEKPIFDYMEFIRVVGTATG